jgi:phosphoribosylanthranilate isomerase
MVRAIDIQQSILQTSPTEKIQQIQQQHADMQQRYMQLHLSEEDRLAREKVNQFKEAEKAKLQKKEEKEEKRKGANQHHPNQAELLTDENDESSGEGGHVNITV